MSRLADKVRVEPLTPDRLAEVERAVLSAYRATELAPPRRWWGALRIALPAAAMAAAIALLLIYRGVGSSPVAQPTPAPTRVVTPVGDSSRIDLGDAVILVGGDTEISIARRGGGIQVALARGTVDCEVAPRAERPPFAVEAGAVQVTVIGTRFLVDRDGDDVRVEVTRGKVRVDAAGASALVVAGHAWHHGEVELAAAAGDRSGEPAGASTGQRAAAEGGDRETAAGSSDDDAAGRDSGAAARAAKARGAKADDAKAHDAKASSATRRRSTSRTEPRAAAARSGSRFGGGVPAPSLSRPLAPPAGGQWDLTRRDHVYSSAHSLFFRDRDPRGALAQIDYFLRRFTKGAFTEEVLELKIRIQCRTASSDCRKAAHSYLRLYPSGDYRDHARALTNWM